MKKANTKMKGFTIVELIGIIVILGILLAMAVPTIGNVISNSYMKAYEIDLKSMEDAAKSYVLKKNIKLEPGENRQIQIYELVDEALIDPILDPRTKEECTGHVTVIDYNDSYKFNSCLKCGTNYISDDCNKTDFIIPTMTLLGDNPVNMYIGETYRDEGATAHDNVNGDITDKIIVTGYVNPDKPGAYTLTYSVEDSEGNEALPLTRTINVIDNVKPIITFKPNGNTTYAKNRSVEVNVRDPNSGIKSGSLKYLWNTSTSAPSEESITTSFTNGETINSPSGVTGSYYLWVIAKDNSNNTAIVKSNVFNLDNTPPAVPTITANPTALTNGNVTVSVSYPTDATIKKVSVNNGSTWSDYTGTLVVTSNTTLLAYATDSSGNQSDNAKYTISNIDKTKPTIAFGTNGNTTYATTRSTKVTVSDNVGISINGLKYLWNTSTTTPSASSFTTTFTNGGTVSTPAGLTGGYYLWISAQDMAGNTTITRSNVFNLDNTSPTVTAKGSSYTITEGASNVISSTYFNITANGTAPITSTTCVDTSKSNAAVTNTSTLAAGTHVIRCTVTKQNGLNAYAQTTIVVNPAYTCSVGTLTNDPVKGYICVTNASTGSSCNSCTYTTSTYGQNCSECGSTCNTCTYQTTTTGPHCDNCGTTCRSCSYVVYTSASCSAYAGSPTCASSDISSSCVKSGYCSGPCSGGGYTACGRDSGCSGGWRCSSYYASYSCPSGYSLDGSSCWKSVKEPNCDKCGEMCASCTYTTSTTGSNCSECGSTCSSCTYTISTYGPNCSECGSYTTYYCSSGWSSYSGSGSNLKCYRTATQ